MLNLLLSFLAVLAFPTWISDSTISFFQQRVFRCACGLLSFSVTARGRQNRRHPSAERVFACAGTAFFHDDRLRPRAGDGWSAIPYGSLPFILSILLYAHVIAQGVSLLFNAMDHRIIASADAPISLSTRIRPLYARRFRLAALLILCWLPCYISTFPGNFMYDASYEYYQTTLGFSASFPLLHSAIITRLLSLSERLTGSVNGGIAAFTLLQMLFGAALFAHILYRFARYSLHPSRLDC